MRHNIIILLLIIQFSGIAQRNINLPLALVYKDSVNIDTTVLDLQFRALRDTKRNIYGPSTSSCRLSRYQIVGIDSLFIADDDFELLMYDFTVQFAGGSHGSISKNNIMNSSKKDILRRSIRGKQTLFMDLSIREKVTNESFQVTITIRSY